MYNTKNNIWNQMKKSNDQTFALEHAKDFKRVRCEKKSCLKKCSKYYMCNLFEMIFVKVHAFPLINYVFKNVCHHIQGTNLSPNFNWWIDQNC
jgi:hypothetical protein